MWEPLEKNEREIPKCFLDTKKRDLNSTMFGYGKNIILLSYIPCKSKNVMVISTLREEGLIDESSDEKNPKLFYTTIPRNRGLMLLTKKK